MSLPHSVIAYSFRRKMIHQPTSPLYQVWIRSVSAHQLNNKQLTAIQTLLDTIPPALNPNATGWLVYNDTAEKPTPALLDEFNEFDDFTLVPTDGEELFDKVDYSFNLDVEMINLKDGAN